MTVLKILMYDIFPVLGQSPSWTIRQKTAFSNITALNNEIYLKI